MKNIKYDLSRYKQAFDKNQQYFMLKCLQIYYLHMLQEPVWHD